MIVPQRTSIHRKPLRVVRSRLLGHLGERVVPSRCLSVHGVPWKEHSDFDQYITPPRQGLGAGSKSATLQGVQYIIGGDILVSISDTWAINTDALATYLEEHTIAGQSIDVGIIQAGASVSVNAALGSRPTAALVALRVGTRDGGVMKHTDDPTRPATLWRSGFLQGRVVAEQAEGGMHD